MMIAAVLRALGHSPPFATAVLLLALAGVTHAQKSGVSLLFSCKYAVPAEIDRWLASPMSTALASHQAVGEVGASVRDRFALFSISVAAGHSVADVKGAIESILDGDTAVWDRAFYKGWDTQVFELPSGLPTLLLFDESSESAPRKAPWHVQRALRRELRERHWSAVSAPVIDRRAYAEFVLASDAMKRRRLVPFDVDASLDHLLLGPSLPPLDHLPEGVLGPVDDWTACYKDIGRLVMMESVGELMFVNGRYAVGVSVLPSKPGMEQGIRSVATKCVQELRRSGGEPSRGLWLRVTGKLDRDKLIVVEGQRDDGADASTREVRHFAQRLQAIDQIAEIFAIHRRGAPGFRVTCRLSASPTDDLRGAIASRLATAAGMIWRVVHPAHPTDRELVIHGPTHELVIETANEMRAALAREPWVRRAQPTAGTRRTFEVELRASSASDPDEARRIVDQCRLATSGATWDIAGDLVSIKGAHDLPALEQWPIRTKAGIVPLASVAQTRVASHPTPLRRRNGECIATLWITLNGEDAPKQLARYLEAARLPAHVRVVISDVA
jgi:hypothetical protein